MDDKLDPRCQELVGRYEVVIRPDEYLGYLATAPSFPKVRGVGSTAAESLASLYNGLLLAIDWYLEHDEPLPDPVPVGAGAAGEG